MAKKNIVYVSDQVNGQPFASVVFQPGIEPYVLASKAATKNLVGRANQGLATFLAKGIKSTGPRSAKRSQQRTTKRTAKATGTRKVTRKTTRRATKAAGK